MNRLRWRLPTPVQDAVLAGFVALMQVLGTRQVMNTGQLALDLTDHVVTGALLVGSGLVLIVRRRWPATVFSIVAAASLIYYIAGYPDGPTWLALFVAAYTVTAHGDGTRSLRLAGAGLHVLVIGWLLTADLSLQGNVGWLLFRIGTTIMAATLGESVRMKRVLEVQAQELAAQAQERAERAERTREEEARRRVDAERLRIAREVHDTVAHAIAIINVQAGATAHVLDKRPEQARQTLMTIEQTSARALRELRATLGVLTVSTDNDDHRSPTPGLEQLDELIARTRAAGLEVTVDVPAHERELPSALDSAAYRILQESLTNAIRHAGGSRVTVALHYGSDSLRIEVADDGRGAAPAKADCGSGRGIAGMRERCELLGGWLTAGPRAAGGFEVRAVLPLRPELVPAK